MRIDADLFWPQRINNYSHPAFAEGYGGQAENIEKPNNERT